MEKTEEKIKKSRSIEDTLDQELSPLIEHEHMDDPIERDQKKRNPFIKDPVAYAAYRNRRTRNRLM